MFSRVWWTYRKEALTRISPADVVSIKINHYAIRKPKVRIHQSDSLSSIHVGALHFGMVAIPVSPEHDAGNL